MEQNVSSSEVITFPSQQPVSQPPPIPPEPSKPRLTRSMRLLMGIILFFLVAIGSIFMVYYFLPKTQFSPTQHIASPESIPEDTVTAFFQAVKSKDKAKAKSFLATNVNKTAFQSTFEDTDNSPSLYNQEFTYKIIDTKTEADKNKIFVNVEISVADQTLPTLITLEKNEASDWLITDSETVSYSSDPLPFEQASQESQRLNRTLLLLNGPAEFYLTSPEGTRTGYDPNTKKQIEEISDISYQFGVQPKTLAITDLVGTWELKVIGTGEGKYSITTQLVRVEDPQGSVIEGNAVLGSVSTYLIRYPSQIGKPLEVTLVK